jgi:hypothetical protein
VYNAWATGDPSLTLPDGKVNLKIWITEIDLESGDALRPPALIRAQHEVGNWVAEGPHVFKKDGWYYLPTAEGGTETEHQVWISRAKHPFGPWETPPSPINLLYTMPTTRMCSRQDTWIWCRARTGAGGLSSSLCAIAMEGSASLGARRSSAPWCGTTVGL